MEHFKEISFREVIQEGLRLKKQRGDKLTTQVTEAAMADKLEDYFGDYVLSYAFNNKKSISQQKIADYYNHVSKRRICEQPCCAGVTADRGRTKDKEGYRLPLKHTTILRELSLVSGCIEMIRAERNLDIPNPFQSFTRSRARLTRNKKSSVIAKRNEHWTSGETKALLLALPPLAKDIVLFALNTGMRRSEICNLTFDSRTQGDEYQRIFEMDGNWVCHFESKDQKSNAVSQCALNSTTMEIINRQEHAVEQELDDLGLPIAHTYVFSLNRKKIPVWWLTQKFAEAQKATGLKHRTLQQTRKTCGQRMLEAGCSIEAVQSQLRHSSVTTTQSYYIVPSIDHAAKAVEKININ